MAGLKFSQAPLMGLLHPSPIRLRLGAYFARNDITMASPKK
jgi:hypothetical protein